MRACLEFCDGADIVVSRRLKRPREGVGNCFYFRWCEAITGFNEIRRELVSFRGYFPRIKGLDGREMRRHADVDGFLHSHLFRLGR